MTQKTLIEAYYAAFNRGDTDAMCQMVTQDIEHFVNQGGCRRGLEAFKAFNEHMTTCYKEQLSDMVIFTDKDRAAAEFTVKGTYLQTDGDLPPARGQTYSLPAGTFFTLRDGKISRITTYYNLEDWLRQIQ